MYEEVLGRAGTGVDVTRLSFRFGTKCGIGLQDRFESTGRPKQKSQLAAQTGQRRKPSLLRPTETRSRSDAGSLGVTSARRGTATTYCFLERHKPLITNAPHAGISH